MNRLVVCCDGTWNALEKLEPEERMATDVLKMSRAVLPRDTMGNAQVVELPSFNARLSILPTFDFGSSGLKKTCLGTL